MNFRITGLAPDPFRALFGLSDEALASRGIRRYVVDCQPGFPDRIEMKDAELGQRMLLLNHVSQPANSPYRASHAIFIREGRPRLTTPSTKCPRSCASDYCPCVLFPRRG